MLNVLLMLLRVEYAQLMELNVSLELHVVLIKVKQLVQLVQMKFLVCLIYQLEQPQELNHADLRNVQISKELLMMLVLE